MAIGAAKAASERGSVAHVAEMRVSGAGGGSRAEEARPGHPQVVSRWSRCLRPTSLAPSEFDWPIVVRATMCCLLLCPVPHSSCIMWRLKVSAIRGIAKREGGSRRANGHPYWSRRSPSSCRRSFRSHRLRLSPARERRKICSLSGAPTTSLIARLSTVGPTIVISRTSPTSPIPSPAKGGSSGRIEPRARTRKQAGRAGRAPSRAPIGS